jgi:hypothetical protein
MDVSRYGLIESYHAFAESLFGERTRCRWSLVRQLVQPASGFGWACLRVQWERLTDWVFTR